MKIDNYENTPLPFPGLSAASSIITMLSPGDGDDPGGSRDDGEDDWSDIDDVDFEDAADDEEDLHEIDLDNNILDPDDDDHLPDEEI